MSLYLGSIKQKLRLDNMSLNIKIITSAPPAPPIDVIRLKSVDGYILKDLNGLYLIPKESE